VPLVGAMAADSAAGLRGAADCWPWFSAHSGRRPRTRCARSRSRGSPAGPGGRCVSLGSRERV